MPPRGRLRELEARRRRAEEGLARFEAAQQRLKVERSLCLQEEVSQLLRVPPFCASCTRSGRRWRRL